MESKWERLREMREKLDETKIKFIESVKHISANFDELYSLYNSMEEELRSLSGEKEEINERDSECEKKLFEGREFSLKKRDKSIERKEKELEKRKHGYKTNYTFKKNLKEMVGGFLIRYWGNVIEGEDDCKKICRKVVKQIIENENAKGLQIPQSRVEVANFLFPKLTEIKRAVEYEVETFKMKKKCPENLQECTLKEKLKEIVEGFLSCHWGNVIEEEDEHKKIAEKVVKEILQKENAKGFEIPQGGVEVANFWLAKKTGIERAVEGEVESFKMKKAKGKEKVF